MPLSEMTLGELEELDVALNVPVDLDGFWASTLAAAAVHPLDVRRTPAPTRLTTLTHEEFSFAGAGGDRVNAWLVRPAGAREPLPAVVEFIGYGGGRGLAEERLTWASAGYAHLVVDTRGQGAVWGGGGSTPDPAGSDVSAPGFLTRGVLDRDTYYYRRVYVDAVRAVQAARSLPDVDPGAVSVTGASQGGGIALAAASLATGVRAVMADVPFLSWFRRAVLVAATDPYAELVRYLSVHRDRVEQVLGTLDHFDVAHLVPRATAPALISLALMDRVCPPSTVWAAHRSYGGPSELVVHPFNDHEGGQAHQWRRQLDWLAGVLADPAAPA
ncbi:acetylxylan esterase [Kineococcus indalonis]|uniref:acetylxylan esterase n=1 Tax=Kineococcus indalonis TaxID=2696566 RepID=UPI002B1BDD61|nr:acetylxylan esterase [Kineococcus indalonis]NAZ85357.1 prolyl oligopeptidase family serine peptidase [Kineococcus indalonis]